MGTRLCNQHAVGLGGMLNQSVRVAADDDIHPWVSLRQFKVDIIAAMRQQDEGIGLVFKIFVVRKHLLCSLEAHLFQIIGMRPWQAIGM